MAEVDATGGRAAHTVARAQTVARWLTEGQSTAEAHQRARETWGVSRRTADRLLAAGRAELVVGWDLERPQMTALLLARLDRVFRDALASDNLNAALGAINAAARIARL